MGVASVDPEVDLARSTVEALVLTADPEAVTAVVTAVVTADPEAVLVPTAGDLADPEEALVNPTATALAVPEVVLIRRQIYSLPRKEALAPPLTTWAWA